MKARASYPPAEPQPEGDGGDAGDEIEEVSATNGT